MKLTDLYKVKRQGGLPKALKGATFSSYEQARTAVRRYIRTTKNYNPWDHSNSNPAISEFGFTIQKL